MTNALTFLFRPEDLKRLLDQNPDQIVITCGLESETAISGEKVGAFKVRARSAFKQARPESSGVLNFFVPGCPTPPCIVGDEEFGIDDKHEMLVLDMKEN